MVFVELRRPAGLVHSLCEDTMIEIVLVKKRIRVKCHNTIGLQPPNGVDNLFAQGNTRGITQDIGLPTQILDAGNTKNCGSLPECLSRNILNPLNRL